MNVRLTLAIVRVVCVLAAGVSLAAGATSATQRGTGSPPTRAPTRVWHVEAEGHGRPAASSDTVYFLSARHEVVAIDAGTGAPRWRQRTLEPGPSTFGSAVAIGGPVVVAGDYNLIAFDRTTGAFRWRFVPVIGYGPGIYLGHATPTVVLAGSPAGRVYAISTATGDLVWSVVIANDGRTTVFQPVIDRGDVAVAFATFSAPPRGGAALFDLATGRERWRTSFPAAADPLLGTGAAGGPAITDNLVIAAGGDGTIHALDRRNGMTRWTLPPVVAPIPGIPAPGPGPHRPPSSGADFRPLTVSGRTLIAGSLGSHVVGYDLAFGRERWRHVDVASGSVSFGAASDDRYAYLPYVSGRHIAIDAVTGVERWRTGTREGFHWPAAVVDGRVYLAGSKGGFVALQR